MLGTPSPVLLYCLPERAGGAGGAGATATGAALPALHAAVEVVGGRQRRYNALFVRHLVVALRPLAVRLEERWVHATQISKVTTLLCMFDSYVLS